MLGNCIENVRKNVPDVCPAGCAPVLLACGGFLKASFGDSVTQSTLSGSRCVPFVSTFTRHPSQCKASTRDAVRKSEGSPPVITMVRDGYWPACATISVSVISLPS